MSVLFCETQLLLHETECLIVGGTGDDQVIAGCRQGCSDCRPHAAIHPHTQTGVENEPGEHGTDGFVRR